jgi:hypothetical protein
MQLIIKKILHYLQSSIQCGYYLSPTADQDLPLLQFDVKNAFLHGDLIEVYMYPLPGIPKYSNIYMVCKLKKALYGLK